MAQSSSATGCDFQCAAIFDPVCASNGETFSSPCEFNRSRCISGDDTLQIAALGVCSSGESSSSASSSSSSSNSNGNSSCLQEFTCLDVYTPVCGSDGRTYINECFLRRAGCSNSTLTVAYSRECVAGTSVSSEGADVGSTNSTSDGCVETPCTKEFLPLCGSDGVTYSNACVLQNAQCSNSSLALAFEGECTAASDSSTSLSGLGREVGSDSAVSSESASSESHATGISHKGFALITIMTTLLAVVAL